MSGPADALGEGVSLAIAILLLAGGLAVPTGLAVGQATPAKTVTDLATCRLHGTLDPRPCPDAEWTYPSEPGADEHAGDVIEGPDGRTYVVVLGSSAEPTAIVALGEDDQQARWTRSLPPEGTAAKEVVGVTEDAIVIAGITDLDPDESRLDIVRLNPSSGEVRDLATVELEASALHASDLGPEGRVYAAVADRNGHGELLEIAADGTVVWRTELSWGSNPHSQLGPLEVGPEGDVVAVNLLEGSFHSGYQLIRLSEVVAARTTDGDILWRTNRTGNYGHLVIQPDEDRLVGVDPFGSLVESRSLSNGSIAWTTDLRSSWAPKDPLVLAEDLGPDGDRLYVAGISDAPCRIVVIPTCLITTPELGALVPSLPPTENPAWAGSVDLDAGEFAWTTVRPADQDEGVSVNDLEVGPSDTVHVVGTLRRSPEAIEDRLSFSPTHDESDTEDALWMRLDADTGEIVGETTYGGLAQGTDGAHDAEVARDGDRLHVGASIWAGPPAEDQWRQTQRTLRQAGLDVRPGHGFDARVITYPLSAEDGDGSQP